MWYLESIHQVRAPPTQWAELELPLIAAARDSDVLLADDREANKAWCVDRQELFLYLTSQLLLDNPEHSGLGFRKEMFAHFFSPSRFWVFLSGYVLVTKGLGTFVLHACSHWSNQSVSWTLWIVGAANLGTRAREG